MKAVHPSGLLWVEDGLPRSTVRSSGLHRLLMEYLHRSPNYLHWGRSESLCQPGYSLSGEAGHTEAPSGTEPNPR